MSKKKQENEKDQAEKKEKKLPWYRRMNKWQRIALFVSIFVGIAASVALSIILIKNNVETPEQMEFTAFEKLADEGKVESATINFGSATFQFTDVNGNTYETANPYTDDFKLRLLEWNIDITELEPSVFPQIMVMLLEYAMLVGLMGVLITTMMPKTGDFDAVKSIPKVTFDDVAGEEELKHDLKNIISYLRDPKPFRDIGAKMPRGIVLYGPPGTGKTLTARAMAGTAGVPFFCVTGSDFIEMFVGLGAKRVRTLFKKARQSGESCVIFIDEIDALGKRSAGIGGSSENNQTINALLNEMDGFSEASGILVIAATNRLEDLDPALVREGRFDMQLAVPLPDKAARRSILEIHKQGKQFEENIDWEGLVSITAGFSGAALASLLNAAAFTAAGDGRLVINQNDIESGMYKIVMKGAKKEGEETRSARDIKICAYHEAGHTVVTRLMTTDSIPQVTIVAGTSGAGGVTFRSPQESMLLTKKELQAYICVCYGGRAAEEIIFGADNVTTGASSDIRSATAYLQQYIDSYGMSSDGLIQFSAFSDNNGVVMNKAIALSSAFYNETVKLLRENLLLLNEIAEQLIEKETLREDELNEIFDHYRNKSDTSIMPKEGDSV